MVVFQINIFYIQKNYFFLIKPFFQNMFSTQLWLGKVFKMSRAKCIPSLKLSTCLQNNSIWIKLFHLITKCFVKWWPQSCIQTNGLWNKYNAFMKAILSIRKTTLWIIWIIINGVSILNFNFLLTSYSCFPSNLKI